MHYFNNSIPVSDGQIGAAERHFNVRLPEKLRTLILAHNGASVECESGRMSCLISFSSDDEGNVYERYSLDGGYLPFGDDGVEGCYTVSANADEGIVHWRHGAEKRSIAKDIDQFLEWLDEE